MIIEEYNQPFIHATAGMGYEAWKKCDDAGVSSRFLGAFLMGRGEDSEEFGYGYPRDCDDFGRCRKFFLAVPIPMDRMDEMKVWPNWAKLVPIWNELVKLYDSGDYRAVDKMISDALKSDGDSE